MLTTSSPKPRKMSPALEAILSNFEASDDFLSGSESSSLVASPVEEMSAFPLEPQSPTQQDSKSMRPERARPQPIQLVLNFLENMMSETDAAGDGEFISSDAVVECCGHSMCTDWKTPTHPFQSGLDNLKARCSAHDLQIDSIFGLGGDVAVFGHFAYEAWPVGSEQMVQFSIWAEVDVQRGQIVRFRWLDQIVLGEDSHIDELETLSRETGNMSR
jgi:hypothetical protein